MSFRTWLREFRRSCRQRTLLSLPSLRSAWLRGVQPSYAAEVNDEYAASEREEVAYA